jgi:hypothetical protein
MADGSACPVMRRLETRAERKGGLARFQISEGATTIYQYGTGSQECNFDPTVHLGPAGYKMLAAVSVERITTMGVLFQDKCKTDKTVLPPDVHPGELIVFYTGGYTTGAVMKGLLIGH